MNDKFQLSCESTVDLPYSYVSKRNISVIFYSYLVDGNEYTDDMCRDSEALPRFYNFIKEGKIPTTSQINTYNYCEYFEELLKKGDLLHIVFGSGMTASIRSANEAAEMMRKKYPDRRLVVIDSYCSSSGYGLLVDMAADLRDEGRSMEEIKEWVEQNCKKIHHQFFSTDLKYFRRSGRMTGAAATVATVLGICPLMRLNKEGRIIAYGKVRGKKNAIKETVDVMEKHAENGKYYSKKCFISHSNCLQDAKTVKAAIKERFPNINEVSIWDIGTIIASHCGPDTVAVYFYGDERPE